MAFLAIPRTSEGITRETFDKDKNYRQVIFQKGKPLIDAELNEVQETLDYRLRKSLASLGSSFFVDSGFLVKERTGSTTNDFSVSAGEGFIKGVFGRLASDLHYSAQAQAEDHVKQFLWDGIVTVPALTTPSGANRDDLVVLNFVLREIDSEEDVTIKDPDYLSETSLRWKVEVGISVLEGFTDDPDDFEAQFSYTNDDGCWRAPIAWLHRLDGNSAITSAMIEDLRDEQLARRLLEYIGKDVLSASGSLITKNDSGAVVEIQVGDDGQVLLADSTIVSSGLRWGTVPPDPAVLSGWNPIASLATFGSASDPLFQMTVGGDLTGVLSEGMLIRLSQNHPLSHYWPLSDNQDVIASTVMTNIGSPTYSAGLFGNSLTLNGVDQALKCADNTFKPTGDFSIVFRMKTSSKSDKTLFQSGSINPNYAGVIIKTVSTSGYLKVIVGKNTGTVLNVDYSVILANVDVCDNQWHQVAIFYKNGAIMVLIDRDVIVRGSVVGIAYPATTFTRIGCLSVNGSSNSEFFGGQIDDLYLIDGVVLDEQTMRDQLESGAAIGSSPLDVIKHFEVDMVSYNGVETAIQLHGGLDYSLSNRVISGVFYSVARAPFRFDTDLDRWSPIVGSDWAFLTSGAFSFPRGKQFVYAILYSAGESAIATRGGSGGAGIVFVTSKESFKGDYNIVYGVPGNRATYFSAFPSVKRSDGANNGGYSYDGDTYMSGQSGGAATYLTGAGGGGGGTYYSTRPAGYGGAGGGGSIPGGVPNGGSGSNPVTAIQALLGGGSGGAGSNAFHGSGGNGGLGAGGGCPTFDSAGGSYGVGGNGFVVLIFF